MNSEFHRLRGLLAASKREQQQEISKLKSINEAIIFANSFPLSLSLGVRLVLIDFHLFGASYVAFLESLNFNAKSKTNSQKPRSIYYVYRWITQLNASLRPPRLVRQMLREWRQTGWSEPISVHQWNAIYWERKQRDSVARSR